MLKHYQRTECGCAKCATCCEIMPGYLVPDDLLPYISATTGKSIWDIKDWSPEKFREWTGGHLLASDGGVARVTVGLLWSMTAELT